MTWKDVYDEIDKEKNEPALELEVQRHSAPAMAKAKKLVGSHSAVLWLWRVAG